MDFSWKQKETKKTGFLNFILFEVNYDGKVQQENNHTKLNECYCKQSYYCCKLLCMKDHQILFFCRIQWIQLYLKNNITHQINKLSQKWKKGKSGQQKDYNMYSKQPEGQKFQVNQMPLAPLFNSQLIFWSILAQQANLHQNLNAPQIKVKEEEIIKEEFIEEKQEYISQSEQEQCIMSQHLKKRKYYIYPGETKNYYKNIGQKLSQFIFQNFSDTLAFDDQHIQQFLRIKNQKYNRNHLENFFQSKKARQIAKQFFGNFLWSSQFLEVNKSEIDLYFRHNPKILKKKISKL